MPSEQGKLMTRRDALGKLVQGAGAAALAGSQALGQGEAPEDRRFRFLLWNDIHIRADELPTYPFATEKAEWCLQCANGEGLVEAPDFIVSAGDIVHTNAAADFDFLKSLILDRLDVPFLPCAGNHENEQGEGIPASNEAYDACFGAGWHNYVFEYGGIRFIVLDDSGGHRPPDDVTAARNAFVERAFEFTSGSPTIMVAHIPLIAKRDLEPYKASFGFSSWRCLDLGALEVLEANAERAIAFLCGHIHITGAREQGGVYHVMPSGTGSYPADFASLDVYADRVDVRMHRCPEQWTGNQAGNIHGKQRHGIDYTDEAHPTHELYVAGTPEEREFSIPLGGAKRPADDAKRELTVWHEVGPGDWEEVAVG